MRRTPALLVAFLLFVLAPAGSVLAEQPDGSVTGVVAAKSLGTEKDVTWHCRIAPEADPSFVLIALEGSRMDPRKQDVGVIWTEGLDRFNVIDFSIADELCSWDTEKWEKACDRYAAAVLETLGACFPDVSAVGVYAFSKGASAADCVCRRVREAGLEISFVWLNDAFTTHGLPYVTELTENGEILLCNRWSRDTRVNELSKGLDARFGSLPNVDSRHISTYHGGLQKYETFAAELVSAVTKASSAP